MDIEKLARNVTIGIEQLGDEIGRRFLRTDQSAEQAARVAKGVLADYLTGKFKLATTLHVLHYGQPICGFTTDTPDKWPEGHRWIGIEDWNQLSNCPGCRDRAAAMTGGTP